MKESAHYRLPSECEKCGSDNLAIKVIFGIGQVRWVCCDCGASDAIPQEENLKKRNNATLNAWARRIINRHPFCEICGSTEQLEAHHIIPVSHSSKFKYKDTNGLTLCHECHYLVHNYEDDFPFKLMD